MASSGKKLQRESRYRVVAKDLDDQTKTGVSCATDENVDTVGDHDHRRNRAIRLWR